jgi:glycosyltransferase involved in cell wall biosynthesis
MTRAWAYCLAYQEQALIAFWVRHYRTFCEKVVVYVDTESTDATAQVARSEGAVVRPYSGTGHLDDFAFIGFARDAYKEARGQADWVVWTDTDEIVYHPRITERLAEFKAAGINLPRTVGYSMLSHSLPTGSGQIYDEIRKGIPAAEYAKVAVFDPALDLSWTAGKHDAVVHSGHAIRDDGSDPLKLLHYRWLGEQYFLERNQRNYSRQDQANLAAGHGRECLPSFTGKYSVQWYLGQTEGAQEVL